MFHIRQYSMTREWHPYKTIFPLGKDASPRRPASQPAGPIGTPAVREDMAGTQSCPHPGFVPSPASDPSLVHVQTRKGPSGGAV